MRNCRDNGTTTIGPDAKTRSSVSSDGHQGAPSFTVWHRLSGAAGGKGDGDLLVKWNPRHREASGGAASLRRKCDTGKIFNAVISIGQSIALPMLAGDTPQRLRRPTLREKRHLAANHGRSEADKKFVPA